MPRYPREKFSLNGHNPDHSNGMAKRAQTLPGSPNPYPTPGFMPPVQPMPLLTSIKQLPQHYQFVTTEPSLETFKAVKGLSTWPLVWAQLAGYTIIATLLSFLKVLFMPQQANAPTSASGISNPQVAQVLTLSTSLGLVVLIPLTFFVAMGMLYLLARVFGGRGTFVQQAYTTLLFLVPFGLAISVLGIIPVVGSFLSAFASVLLFVYGVVLECFATVAVHHMTGGKATAAVVLSALIMIPVALALVFVLAVLFYAF